MQRGLPVTFKFGSSLFRLAPKTDRVKATAILEFINVEKNMYSY